MNRESKYLLPPECRYSSSRRVPARGTSRLRPHLAPRHKVVDKSQPVAVLDPVEAVDESQPIGEPEYIVTPRFAPRTAPSAPRVPSIPGAINISELAGNEIVAIGVVGSISAQTTTADIAALAAGGGGSTETYVKLDNVSSYTLLDGTAQHQRVGIKDNLRVASANNPIIINGKLDGGTSLPINIAGTALEFVWDVASDTWMVF